MFRLLKRLFQRKSTSVHSIDPVIITGDKLLQASLNSKDGNLYNEFKSIVNESLELK